MGKATPGPPPGAGRRGRRGARAPREQVGGLRFFSDISRASSREPIDAATTDSPAATALLTAGALTAFAANSILCRLALLEGLIDPTLFAAVRLGSGAAALAGIAALRGTRPLPSGRAALVPGLLLFLYALPFSLAYVEITAATGALILFGSVQITMTVAAIRSGYRPSALEWGGTAAAFAGLVYLAAPGVEAPSPSGALLMTSAGISWGLYTLRGRSSRTPLSDNAGNFIVASVPAVLAAGVALPAGPPDIRGAALAILSGAIASGLGYAVWYRALRGLTEVRAAVVQLSVPVLAALGGALLLAEPLTPRLGIAAGAVLGGIAAAIAGKRFHHTGARPPWK